jgi:hypothetical protein
VLARQEVEEPRRARNSSVRIKDDATETAVEVSPRYMGHLQLPDTVIGWTPLPVAAKTPYALLRRQPEPDLVGPTAEKLKGRRPPGSLTSLCRSSELLIGKALSIRARRFAAAADTTKPVGAAGPFRSRAVWRHLRHEAVSVLPRPAHTA